MSRRASVFLGSLGTSLLVASTALAQTPPPSTEPAPAAPPPGGQPAPAAQPAPAPAPAPGASAGGSFSLGGGASADATGAGADADVEGDAASSGEGGADLDPGHRFLFDLHVGALAELDADPETESFGGALVGGGIYYGPLDWLSLGLTYERIFLGRDDEVLGDEQTRRTSRGANALWLNGRLYPYEDDNIALFFEVAGGPVWQDISVSAEEPLPVEIDSGSALTSSCDAGDSAKLGMRGGFGIEFPLRSILIMTAQVGVDHYRFGEEEIDGCGTGGNPATYFAGRLGFAVATGRIKQRDTDGDGILDDVDACPEVRGVASEDPEKNGCPPPDRDRDTVLDPVDACPDVPGAVQADPAKNGCPLPGDADGDGIADPQDACRDVPGVANADPAKNGCPADKDGDGVLDAADACPEVPGPANADPAKNGCPLPTDTDGDGIDDPQDACPKDPGKADPDPKKNGCPLVVVTDKEIVINEQVQFETGQATIKPESNALLDNVAQVIKQNPRIKKLEVQGHTDNKGSAQLNKTLSQRRAEAVKKALETRGVAPAALVPKGYGPDKPLDDNTTDAGRAKNRRVQFVILEQDAAAPAGGATPAGGAPAGGAPAGGAPAGGAPAGGTPAGGAPAPAGGTPPKKP